MKRDEIINNFNEILHQTFGLDGNGRRLILEIIEHLEDVKGKEKTNEELAEKCKLAYQILKDKQAFVEFISILKETNKLGAFANTTYWK